MEYSISEASRLLKTTRVTVYKKIDRLDGIQQHIQTRGKSKYINDIGIELIRKSLLNSCKDSIQSDIQSVNTYTNNENDNKEEISNTDDSKVYTPIQSDIHIEHINSLKEHIGNLKYELNKKDEQIQSQSKQLESLTATIESNSRFQMMLQNKVLMLEQWKEQQEQTKDIVQVDAEPEKTKEIIPDKPEQNKSFWVKLRNRFSN